MPMMHYDPYKEEPQPTNSEYLSLIYNLLTQIKAVLIVIQRTANSINNKLEKKSE